MRELISIHGLRRRPHVATLKYFHFFLFNIFISRYLCTHTHTQSSDCRCFFLPLSQPAAFVIVVFLFAFVQERKQRNTCIHTRTYVHMFAFCMYTDCLIMPVKPLDLQFESSARYSTFIEIINSMETVHIRLFICYCSCTICDACLRVCMRSASS